MTKQSTNQTSINQLKDIELDAVVGGSLLSAVKQAVKLGAYKAENRLSEGGSFGGVAMKAGGIMNHSL